MDGFLPARVVCMRFHMLDLRHFISLFSKKHGRKSMKKSVLISIAVLLFVATLIVRPAAALEISGRVFDDSNGNGVLDTDENALDGIVVSDGEAVTRTGKEGMYSLKTTSGKIVFVSVPGTHHAPANKFYRYVQDQGKPAAYDFALRRNPGNNDGKFAFVFASDTHLGFLRHARDGTAKAFAAVMELSPDLVIHGGDIIYDALGTDEGLARKQYELYVNELAPLIRVPFYHAVGNHDVFGWYSMSEAKSALPLYGKGMYEKYFGPRYYSFNYDQCHFVVLDSIARGTQQGGKITYFGWVDHAQLDWLRKDLQQVDASRPIVLVTHIPTINALFSVFGLKGEFAVTPAGETVPKHQISNFSELFKLFSGHNFKLALAGHHHTYEEIHWKNNMQDALLVVGGSVCGEWWKGDREIGFVSWPEGFTLVKVDGEQFEVSYISYGWKGENEE
jgi:Icc protein